MTSSGVDKSSPSVLAIAVLASTAFATALLYLAMSWNSASAGFLSDDAVYLLMADGFSPYHTSDPALISYVFRQTLFPPFYPLLLAILGGGSEHLSWSHFLTSSTFVAALYFFWRWTWSETRSLTAATSLIVVYALLPETLLFNFELMSEFPYLMLTLVALNGAAKAQKHFSTYVVVAACVGLAAITRTAGISLVVALFVWLFRKDMRGRLILIATAIAPTAAWASYKRVHGFGESYDQLWQSLGSQIHAQGFFSFVPRYLIDQFIAAWHGVLMHFDVLPSGTTMLLTAVILTSAVPTFVSRIRGWCMDAWYLMFGVVMTLLYPFPDHFTRLFLPFIPIVLLYSWLTILKFTTGWNRTSRVSIRLALCGGTVTALLPSLFFLSSRLNEAVAPPLLGWKHTSYWYQLRDLTTIRDDVAARQRLIDANRDLKALVPVGECVFSLRVALTMLYSGRVAWSPPPPSQSSGEQFALRLKSCPTVFLVGAPGRVGVEAVPAYYPAELLDKASYRMIRVWDSASGPGSPTAEAVRAVSNE